MIREDALNIFTDGSSFSGPRVGGVGIRIVTVNEAGHEVIEDFPVTGYRGATNNQMELFACVCGLRKAASHSRVNAYNRIYIFTDSMYVVDNFKNALFVWPKQKWMTYAGTPVLNANLWKDLIREIKNHAPRRVEIHWIKGHARNIHNKAVDKLAKASAKLALNPPLSIVSVRRKQTSQSFEIGSVEMRGQRLAIRIVTCEYLKVQRLHKYKYEVLSKGSKYFGKLDLIYSTHDLRAGHHYEVSVNKNKANPIITNVIRELERKSH
jgi:ribonuclease HI